MKVSELIKRLQEVDPDNIVVLSRDGEGNGYRRLAGVDTSSRYNPEEDEVGLRELTEADRRSGYSEEDVMEEGEDCVILWPVY